MGRTVSIKYELAEERGELPVQIFGGGTMTFHISNAQERVLSLLKGFTKLEIEVLYCCLGHGQCESHVAGALGMSRNQVHGIKSRAIKKVKARAAKS